MAAQNDLDVNSSSSHPTLSVPRLPRWREPCPLIVGRPRRRCPLPNPRSLPALHTRAAQRQLPLSEFARTLREMSTSALPERIRVGTADYATRLREALGSRVRSVRLFGSWARGTARHDSDVDVWVLVDRLDAMARRVPYDLAIEMLVEHGVDIAPTVMDDLEWALLRNRERRIARDIETEGVPL
jgi:predicted nucleotidyltransferase